MASLVHLIYSSAATRQMSVGDVSDLLETARRNNKKLSVTGILLYVDGSFFQVLEGEEAVVMTLFERIGKDPRHTSVTSIICEPIAQRTFGEWTMAYSFVSEEELESILDAKGIHKQRHSVVGLREGRARKLLEAFAKGRWRQRLVTHLTGAVTA